MTTLQVRGLWTAVARTIGWVAIGLAAIYALYALSAAITEIVALAGAAPDAKPRSAPPIFIVHAISGAVALASGALQLKLGRPTSRGRRALHRAAGRSYVVSAGITCVGGALISVVFDVGPVGTLAFIAWSTSWFAATAYALTHIRRGRVQEHRRWAIRSYALAAVFVTFDFARQALAAAGLPPAVVYPVAIAVCTGAHAATAEWWIRTRSPRRSRTPLVYARGAP